jgi:hypothetical protein
MYWPIGAPRIYAASNGRPSKERVLHFDDGAESPEAADGSGVLPDLPSSGLDVIHDGDGEASGLLAPTSISPRISPVEHDARQRLSTNVVEHREDELEDAVGQAEKGHILSLKISRSGHLFAVITTTSLTIWQTKVLQAINWRKEFAHNP